MIGTLFASEAASEHDLAASAIAHLPKDLTDEVQLGPVTLYLEVFLNQTRQADLFKIWQHGDALFAQADDLRRLGFLLEQQNDPDDGLIPLRSLPGLGVDYRVNTQQLMLTAPLTLLSLPTTKLWADTSRDASAASAAPGAMLNYDLYVNRDDDNRIASAATEFRLFGFGRGVFSHTAISRVQRSDSNGWNTESTALDTFVEWSFPENATRVIVGDMVSGGLDWSRPLRLTGLQYGRHFRLQPYRVTSPPVAFLGQATLPSTVELYIDGMRRYKSNVPVGPFELNTVPGINGAGQAQIVTTDIFGRSATLDIPFYSTQQLLAKGLSEWTVNLGAVHEDYGLRSFSYGNELIATGSLRYGLTNRFTLESHVETGGDLINGGIGVVWQPSLAGVISVAATRSEENGETGHQTAWRYSWSNARFNFSVASQRTFGQYRDIASHSGTLPPRRSEQMLFGMHTAGSGSVGINVTRFDYAEDDEQPSRYAGVYWSNSLGGGIYLNFSYNQNLNESADRNLQLGINISFGDDYQFSSTVQRNVGENNYRTSLQRALPSDGGYGWRLQAGQNDQMTNALAEGSWQGEHGRLDAGIARTGDRQAGYAQASGGLVLVDRQGFVSRRVNDSFAVVSTAGIPNVPVKLENRVIGYTNDNGNLLVARLNAWQRNRLSIDPMDLPLNAKVTTIEHIATPSDRAGTVVRFSIEKVRAAVVVLTDIYGKPLPVASQVQQRDTGDRLAFVGFEGQTYLEGLADHNRLRVYTPDGICNAEFDHHEGENHYIGPVPCLNETFQ